MRFDAGFPRAAFIFFMFVACCLIVKNCLIVKKSFKSSKFEVVFLS